MNLNFEEASSKEYLLTTGIGGYSSSSIGGANTRRYHGLLVASFNPPVDRMVLVSKIEETIVTAEGNHELSSNQYPGAIYPNGYRYIESYECDTEKVTVNYKVGNLSLSKTIEVIEGENSVVVNYTNLSSNAIKLLLMPLLVYRSFHSLFSEDEQFDFFRETLGDNYFKVYAKYQAHPLFIKFSRGEWIEEHHWYKKIQYKQEEIRGLDCEEDTMSIGKLEVSLGAKESTQFIFSTDYISDFRKRSIEKNIADNNYPTFIDDLIRSSRQFVVSRRSTGSSTIIAGYHWFADWGRDTMIALRGISIATGNKDEAASILKTFLGAVSEGMLPNRFPDYSGDEMEYNTIDATLWLFIALYEYQQKFKDNKLIKEALPILKEIIECHIKGTRYNIHVNAAGLLYGGEIGQQLTWMDAKVDGFVVTPRIGCPVEINALWYNALNIYRFLNMEISNPSNHEFDQLIQNCKQSFTTFFINERGYLNDVIIPGKCPDETIRPNQIYSVSLPFSPIEKEQQDRILACVSEKLLTPYGLRTLNIDDANFKPIYEGNPWQRDNAYHQGTVWPFLWGEWALAYLKQNTFSAEGCKYVWDQSADLRSHFYNDGCGFAIAEIFDGLKPGKGKGCVQQAWSVGMLLAVFLNVNFNWSLIKD